MKERQVLECCQCGEPFSIRLKNTLPKDQIVGCPYCHAQCLVEFDKVDEIVEVLRDGDTTINTGELNLPEIMPTKRNDTESADE